MDALDRNAAGDCEDGEEGLPRHGVTACGRCTGRIIYKTSINDQFHSSNLTLILVHLGLS